MIPCEECQEHPSVVEVPKLIGSSFSEKYLCLDCLTGQTEDTEEQP